MYIKVSDLVSSGVAGTAPTVNAAAAAESKADSSGLLEHA